MSVFETIIYEKQDGIGFVTLNRPASLNVYNIKMRDDLFEVFSAVKDDREVKVVIVRGAGEKAFCAGADLSEFLTAPPPVFAREARFGRDIWKLMANLPQPLIAALHGYVLGSGIEISLFCDISIASDDTKFGLPEVGLGIIPAAGGTQTLPRTAGIACAMDMLLANRWIDAGEALRVKLVNRIVPRKELWLAAESLAQKMASYRSPALTLAKQAVVQGLDMSLPDGLELESRLSRLL
jgi:enoyl-CoA hydratase